MAKANRGKGKKPHGEDLPAPAPDPPRPAAAAPVPQAPAPAAIPPSVPAAPPPPLDYGRASASPHLNDPAYRQRWGLPAGDAEPGDYMVELNLRHAGGLAGAANAFLELYGTVVPGPEQDDDPRRKPVRVAKTYYSCYVSAREWQALAERDERNPPGRRAIYRIWPDFPVRSHVDRSIATVKADAAFRSYDASGDGITWAVIDSGVEAEHPHFGPPAPAADGGDAAPGGGNSADPGRPEGHTLRSPDVSDLHRCFGKFNKVTRPNGLEFFTRLDDPDADPSLPPEKRQALVAEHTALALRDDFGHGTHVAGIIAGGLGGGARCRAFERKFDADDDSRGAGPKRYAQRPVKDPARLRGAAPRCRLVSLRVLDAAGEGRASDLILALEYVRERLNGDPKLLRVHGVNLSVGYEFDAELFACGQSPLCVEVNRLVQSGVVVVTAAGNSGYGTIGSSPGTPNKAVIANTINDPGNADAAITVGATHRDSPHTYGVSYFSSKGPTGDGRLKPDLVAPGERITSCATRDRAGRILASLGQAPPAAGPQDPHGPPEACYVDDTGTSMAAPHVSGAIAAFLSIRREFIGRPADVKRIFLQSAISLGREKYFEGHGLVDLMGAIQSV